MAEDPLLSLELAHLTSEPARTAYQVSLRSLRDARTIEELMAAYTVCDFSDQQLELLQSPMLHGLQYIQSELEHTVWNCVPDIPYHRNLPLVKQLQEHVAIGMLAVEFGNVALLTFLKMRGLRIDYTRDIYRWAILSNNEEMLDYIRETESCVEFNLYCKEKGGALMAAIEGRCISIEWMVTKQGYVTVEDFQGSEVAYPVESLTKLLELGMEPPLDLFGISVQQMQVFLDHDTPATYWPKPLKRLASPDVYYLLLENGYEPDKAELRELLFSPCYAPSVRYLLEKKGRRPEWFDMWMLISEPSLNDMFRLVMELNAYDPKQDGYHLWHAHRAEQDRYPLLQQIRPLGRLRSRSPDFSPLSEPEPEPETGTKANAKAAVSSRKHRRTPSTVAPMKTRKNKKKKKGQQTAAPS
jgi:hypothetical protein